MLDLWLADSINPTPLVVFIHGGGFYTGSKEDIYSHHYYEEQGTSLVEIYLESGISVASINYRLTERHPEWAYTQRWYDQNPVPAPMFDSGTAIAFLRTHSKDYNIDPNKIAATGFSAGGAICLWLAFNDDIPSIMRPNCVGPWNAQSTLNLSMISKLMPGTEAYRNWKLLAFYGIDPDDFNLSQADKYETLFNMASPITHVSEGDPPVFMHYPKVSLFNKSGNLTDNIHSPIFGLYASGFFRDLDIPYELYYRVDPDDDLMSDYEAALMMMDFFDEYCFHSTQLEYLFNQFISLSYR